MNKRIAVYIDGIVRKPNVQKALIYFGSLAENLLEPVKNSDSEFHVESSSEVGISSYWAEQFKDEEIKKYYKEFFVDRLKEIKTEEQLEDLFDLDLEDAKKIFKTEEHYAKFLEDFNYFIFVQGERFNFNFVEYLRLIQQKFEVDLIDVMHSPAQAKHTIKFLSKFYVPSKKIVFLYEKEKLGENQYDLVLDNRNFSDEFTDEFLLNKLKELECKLDQN